MLGMPQPSSTAEPLTDIPTVNSLNFPPSAIPTISSVAPPVPQPPSIPFPSIQQINAQPGSIISTDSGAVQTGPLFNQMPMLFVCTPFCKHGFLRP